MEPIIVGLVAAFSALIVQAIGFYFNRKTGLAPVQVQYQDTLEGMNKTLAYRVEELERTVTSLTSANSSLTVKVEDLETEVRRLTRENYEMARQLLEAARNK